MLVREITQAIVKQRFKEILEFILAHLPTHITLASGAKVARNQISYIDFGVGAGLVSEKAEDIITQMPNPDKTAINVLSKFDKKNWDKLVASLPESQHNLFLQCLHLHPSFEILFEAEASEINSQDVLPLQKQKLLIEKRPDGDLPLLSNAAGLVYLHCHLHVESWEFMSHRMTLFKNAGVTVLYLELPKTVLGPVFQQFNQAGDKQCLLEHLTFYRLNLPEQKPYYIDLCVAARANGIEIIPIDSSGALFVEGNATVANLIKNNQFRDQYMRLQICKHQREGPGNKKFVALVGIYHADVARQLNLPTIGLHPNAQAQSLIPQQLTSQGMYEWLRALREKADINFVLSSTYQPKAKSGCPSLLMRVGFFAAAVVGVAAVAASYAAQRYGAPV
jgi:hypothetical protein